MLENIKQVYKFHDSSERGEIPAQIIAIAILVVIVIYAFGKIGGATKEKSDTIADCIKNAGTSQAQIAKCQEAYGIE